MQKIVPVIFLVLLVCGCEPITFSDEEKIASLEKLCKEQASETIVENSADGSVLLSGESVVAGISNGTVSNSTFKNLKEPIGSANLPALDLEYSPGYILRNLFAGYDPLMEVIFTRGTTGVNQSIPTECRITHMLSVKNKEESEAAFLNKCDVNSIVKSVDGVRYYIGQAYGDLDDHEIRKFTFYVKDRTSGRILAEQHSFQLLMGGMESKEIRNRHGWGSSQGTRTCKLTPPDQVVKRVFR